jgi:hypothetical protein
MMQKATFAISGVGVEKVIASGGVLGVEGAR